MTSLRDQIAQAIRDSVDIWIASEALVNREVNANADAVLAVLKSHPEAVLNHLGTVRKWFEFEECPEWKTVNGERVPASLHLYAEPHDDGDVPVFVVSLDDTAKDAS